MARLRRTAPDQPGWTRQGRGSGFVYLDRHGDRITDPAALQRLHDLVIPPAWRDVWVTPYPNGHLQAVGTDARGRRQYLYHPDWMEQRSKAKHARIIDFARRLPAARERVAADLARPGMPREKALAISFRLLDLGLFRVGSEVYTEENGSFGLATVRKEHVHLHPRDATFCYVAKSGNQRRIRICDPDVVAALSTLKRRRAGGEELLAWRTTSGWHDLGSEDINHYVKAVVDHEASAKDFRTWHATVLAALALAGRPAPASATAAKREVARVMREVSEYLGNTPAVCRASYVDPRVIERFRAGNTLKAALARTDAAGAEDAAVDGVLPPTADARVERAVLRLLRDG